MSVDAQLPEIIPLLYKNAPAFRQRLEVTAVAQIPPGSPLIRDERSWE
jgi:hypothetical protein